MRTPAAATMTAKEFVRDYGNRSGFELVLGHLLEIPRPTGLHGGVSANALMLIGNYAKAHKLGRVATNDTFIRVHHDPDSYRGADVLFVSYERLPKFLPLPSGPFETPPDLVVEVRSPSDRLKAVLAKGQEYLDAGVKVVMILDPETESLGVFRQDELPIRFHNGDTVTFPDVLPGFAVAVKAFFE